MNYQLVLQFPVNESTDFDLLIDLESQLVIGLGGIHCVDGHDFGSGEMNIFILTEDPKDAFSEISRLIDLGEFPGVRAAFRQIGKEKFTWLLPKESIEPFSIK